MRHSHLISVSCTAHSETILQKARHLAIKLQLPFCLSHECTSEFVLAYTDTRLELQHPRAGSSGNPGKPLAVDFLRGATGYRHSHNCTVKQPLARAVGIKPGFRPVIFDATAGMGGDAFALACLGCKIILNERSVVMGALLTDGLERAARDIKTTEIVTERMHLYIGDAVTTLKQLETPPYTIYLDPMYPHSQKSALNKKEMRIIRALVGDDPDSPALLTQSLLHATNRVVVKRPKGAPTLGDDQPSHTIEMKNSRFDVYLVHHL